jgi:hypothetical protein
MAKDKGKEFIGPKWICTCGHTGDGIGSDHVSYEGHTGPGLGECLLCDCGFFRWCKKTKRYENFLKGQE